MILTTIRFHYDEHFTISKLYVNGVYECYVLEDKVREPGVKVLHETAIPEGTYKVIIDFSNRFQKELPHILDVPMFGGIRIHSGNTDKDTEGCLLVGTGWTGGDFVLNSREAFSHLFAKLLATKEEITISIQDKR